MHHWVLGPGDALAIEQALDHWMVRFQRQMAEFQSDVKKAHELAKRHVRAGNTVPLEWDPRSVSSHVAYQELAHELMEAAHAEEHDSMLHEGRHME